jgi:hypothetical protein
MSPLFYRSVVLWWAITVFRVVLVVVFLNHNCGLLVFDLLKGCLVESFTVFRRLWYFLQWSK